MGHAFCGDRFRAWCLTPVEWKGMKWCVILFFREDALHMIQIAADSPEFGLSWDGWSEEKEMRRKCYHDEVLNQDLGPPPYDFPWDSVRSVFDAKGGSSAILLEMK